VVRRSFAQRARINLIAMKTELSALAQASEATGLSVEELVQEAVTEFLSDDERWYLKSET
jgi:hypothetical protein